MTTITTEMIKIGELKGANAGGVIYQDGDSFFYKVNGWKIENNNEVDYESESDRFSSLEELLLSVPFGIHFQPDGEVETPESIHSRMRLLIKMTRTPEAIEFVEKIRREHKLNNIREIYQIFEAQEGELSRVKKNVGIAS